MKKFLVIIVISLCFTTSSQANDIRDFQIEGMSIGDSLMDYYSNEEIKNFTKVKYDKSDEYIKLEGLSSKTNKYDTLSVHIEKDDKKYKIHSISGGIFFRKSFEECFKKKKEIVNSFKSSLKKVNLREYEFKYKIDDSKSIAYISDFDHKDGSSIRVWCVNWSKVTEDKRQFVDNLAINLSPNYFLKWRNYKAN